jgi:hypothetical protein
LFKCIKTIYLNEILNAFKILFKRESLIDPFQRNARIPLIYNGKVHTTTIAQLCFFRWCIQYKILDYVEKHKCLINDDMKNYTCKQNETCNGSPKGERNSSNGNSGSYKIRKKRRSEMTAIATKVICKDNEETIIISFD